MGANRTNHSALFNNLPPERLRELARMGGKATSARGKNKWTREEARRWAQVAVQMRKLGR
jgi:hypothetical protein